MKARLLKFPQNDVSGKVDNQSCLPLRLFYNLPCEVPNILWLCTTYVSALTRIRLLFIISLNFITRCSTAEACYPGVNGQPACAFRLTTMPCQTGFGFHCQVYI